MKMLIGRWCNTLVVSKNLCGGLFLEMSCFVAPYNSSFVSAQKILALSCSWDPCCFFWHMCGAPHLQWPVSCTQHILRASVLVFWVLPRMSWTLGAFLKSMWWSQMRGQWFCCTLEFFLCLCPQVSLLGWALGPLLFLLTHVVCSTHGVDCPLHPTHSFGQSVSIWGVPQDELDPWSILSTFRV